MILQGILFPEANGRYSCPFDDLQVGEGFVILHRDAKNSARVSANHYMKKHPGWKYSIALHEHGWRLARDA